MARLYINKAYLHLNKEQADWISVFFCYCVFVHWAKNSYGIAYDIAYGRNEIK